MSFSVDYDSKIVRRYLNRARVQFYNRFANEQTKTWFIIITTGTGYIDGKKMTMNIEYEKYFEIHIKEIIRMVGCA